MHLVTGTVRPTPTPWLHVLSNIEPPALRRKAAVDKLLAKADHEDWGLHDDIMNPPTHTLWRDMQPTDIMTRWREEWKSASVVNSVLERDLAIRQPGFDLP